MTYGIFKDGKEVEDMMDEKLSEQMIRYRAKERISQKELAARCGVSLQTINSIENGIQDPSKVTEAKIRLVIEGKEGGK